MKSKLYPFTGLLACSALLALCSLQATHGQITQAESASEKVQPNLLQRFVGNWTATSTSLDESGEPTDEQYTTQVHARMMGEMWVTCEYQGDVGPVGKFRSQQSIGVNPDGQVIGIWIDSTSSHIWNYTGEFQAETLTLSAQGPSFANPNVMADYRDSYQFIDADTIGLTSEYKDSDGKWIVFMKGKMERDPSDSSSTAGSVTPFLMFEGQAKQAMEFYVEILPNSRVIESTEYGPDEQGPEGTIFVATFSLNGQKIMCSDSPIEHGFTFTPSSSLFIECESTEQLQGLFDKLSPDGEVMMPVGNYGFSQKFAWVQDRFGVSWQLNLK